MLFVLLERHIMRMRIFVSPFGNLWTFWYYCPLRRSTVSTVPLAGLLEDLVQVHQQPHSVSDKIRLPGNSFNLGENTFLSSLSRWFSLCLLENKVWSTCLQANLWAENALQEHQLWGRKGSLVGKERGQMHKDIYQASHSFKINATRWSDSSAERQRKLLHFVVLRTSWTWGRKGDTCTC